MRISLFSNYLNEHQLALCRALDARDDVDFTFVALREGGNVGRNDFNTAFPFVLREYEGEAAAKEALRHAEEDDVAIFAAMSGKNHYVDRRMARGLLSLKAIERILKRGLWWRFAPPKALRTYRRFIRFKDAPLYVLCASAYASYDLSLSGWPQDKCFKWGYFPDIGTREASQRPHGDGAAELVWVARFVDWKRPQAAIEAAKQLKEAGYRFRLRMVGDGPLRPELERQVAQQGLGDVVEFCGVLARDEVRAVMEGADIFLATASRMEGWGVVVNEAMASGCAVVASASMGSAPYLIRDGANGLLYDDLGKGDLLAKTALLLDGATLRASLAANARRTVEGAWSAESAAERLVTLIGAIKAGEPTPYTEGPCSPAPAIADDWYHRAARR